MILLHVCVSCEINPLLEQRETDLTCSFLSFLLLFSFVSDILLLAALLMSSDGEELRAADALDFYFKCLFISPVLSAVICSKAENRAESMSEY